MYIQLLKVINGPQPRTVIVLIIEDRTGDGNYAGQLLLEDYSQYSTYNGTIISRQIFFNGDSIYDVMVTPAGDIWACSARGNIYTTANVAFPEPTATSRFHADSDIARDSGYRWKMYPLGSVHSCASIWSPDGVTVFVGTYGGLVHIWDGKAWTTLETPTSKKASNEISQFAGSSGNDVYAIGSFARDLLHYDGVTWSPTAYDENIHGRLQAAGIARDDDGNYYLACAGGRVWKTRNGQQFDLVAEDPALKFSGITYAFDVILVAAGDRGVFAVKDGQFINLRDTFSAHSASGRGKQVVFNRPATEEENKIILAYVLYTDSATPWVGRTLAYAVPE